MKIVLKQIWSGIKIFFITSMKGNESRLYNQYEAKVKVVFITSMKRNESRLYNQYEAKWESTL